MKRLFLLIFIFLTAITCFSSCRGKKFQDVDKKHNEERTSKIGYINIYNVNFNTSQGKKYFIVDINFYANNKSDKTVYWFQVLIDIYSGGKLTHSIIYTPNYYKGKNTDIKYYHTLAPGQTGQFRVILGENYKIKNNPDYVKVNTFAVGDNINIFKKIRVNPDKYFIPYIPGE